MAHTSAAYNSQSPPPSTSRGFKFSVHSQEHKARQADSFAPARVRHYKVTRPCTTQLQLAAQQLVMMISMLHTAMHLVLQRIVLHSTTLINPRGFMDLQAMLKLSLAWEWPHAPFNDVCKLSQP